ncbi:unnamed protein product [Adineta ricciae]|uniref:Carboxylesterase type B domain-containing protein n=1 Tax=Adineta ricciae TaxID=249248 RepID=A0A815MXI5_ADIRI|nr:unnamed protein product [Adineta ricciae]
MAHIEQGIYIGRQMTTNGTNVNYWLGIPYAQQSVGSLRWTPPQALATANETAEAYVDNSCLQEYNFGFLRTETCLTLNVYAPENASRLPVFVWIHDDAFTSGAATHQITVGGESAGGISITLLLTSSLVADDAFQRAIVQSSSMWPSLLFTLQEATNKTVQRMISSQNIYGLFVLPVIDGYVLDDIMENYYAQRNFKRIPVLIGSTASETTTMTYRIFNDTINSTQAQNFLETLYNTTIIDKLPTVYGPMATYGNPFTYLNVIYSDAWVKCGARRLAARFSEYVVPSYLYTYSYIVSAAPSCCGAVHTAELPMLFPSYLRYLYRNYTFTALDQQLSKNVALYWAHFIYNSDHNYDINPTNWSVCCSSTDNDLTIGTNPHMRSYYYNLTCSGLWDQYAVTNSTTAASTMKYDCTSQYYLSLFVLFSITIYVHV